jgi:hypothetical protein
MSNVINSVAVTIASLNKPGAYFANDNVTMSHSGLVISGWKIEIGHAVFCGRVLETKVIFLVATSKIEILLFEVDF